MPNYNPEVTAELLALDEKRTPGEWRYDDGVTDEKLNPPERGKPQTVVAADLERLLELGFYGRPIADVYPGDTKLFGLDEGDNNGRFIAAAPRLAAQLREADAEVRRLREALYEKREAEAKVPTRLIENVDKGFEYDAGERGWRPTVTIEFALTQCDLESEAWTARDAFAQAIHAALSPPGESKEGG